MESSAFEMITSHVPSGWKLRPIQVDILTAVERAFDSGKNFVILEAPPGSGKSLCAATLTNAYGPSYVCTLTKQLQAQYITDFQSIGARELKGKASYWCDRANGTCEVGSTKFQFENRCDKCPYRIAKAKALAAKMTICNYSSYLYNISGSQGGKRPLLILDEAHEAESVLLDFIGVSVDGTALPIPVSAPFPDANNVEACFEWLMEFMLAAGNMEPEELNDLSEKAAKEFERLVKKASYALELRDKEKWISEPMAKRTGFVLKPLTVKSFGERLFRFGEKVLIMSATILDPESVAQSLGVEDFAFVQAPCPFPKENRPVVVGNLDMTKKARGESWPAMVKQVEAILQNHQNEKGLILTPSVEMIKFLEAGLPYEMKSRFLVAYGSQRLDKYNEHLNAKRPTILVAPGLWEGADLKDDFSRFQIIPALPRLFWAGQVAARAKIDPKWYRLQTFCKLVQGVGRSVRSETDSAVTYVLDIDLRGEYQRSDTMLPEWFREAMEFV